MSINNDQILAYLDGTITAAERIKMEQFIQDDPQLKLDLEAFSDMNQFLKDKLEKDEALSNLKAVHQEMTQVEGGPDLDKSDHGLAKNGLRLLALIAGCIGLFYLGYQIINKGVGTITPSEAPELLYAAHFDPATISFTSRSDDAEGDALKIGADAFNNKDYSSAIKTFETYLDLGEVNPRVSYAYGIALVANGQGDQARKVLSQLMTSHPVYKDDALWYIAMSHLSEGSKEHENGAARASLAGISKTSNRYRAAFGLLNDLGE